MAAGRMMHILRAFSWSELFLRGFRLSGLKLFGFKFVGLVFGRCSYLEFRSLGVGSTMKQLETRGANESGPFCVLTPLFRPHG